MAQVWIHQDPATAPRNRTFRRKSPILVQIATGHALCSNTALAVTSLGGPGSRE
jgi:hypothetical protein